MWCQKLFTVRGGRLGTYLRLTVEIGMSSPNNLRQHRTLHILKHVLPYVLCRLLCPFLAALASISRMDISHSLARVLVACFPAG